MGRVILYFLGLLFLLTVVLGMRESIALWIAGIGALIAVYGDRAASFTDKLSASSGGGAQSAEMVIPTANSLAKLDLDDVFSEIDTEIVQAKAKKDVSLWSRNLELLSKGLSERVIWLEATFNRVIMKGVAEMQRHLAEGVKRHEEILQNQGIRVTEDEIAQVGLRRRLRVDFEYPKFAQAKRIERNLAKSFNAAGVMAAKGFQTGGAQGGLVGAAIGLGISAVMYNHQKSKALRVLEEAQGEVDLYRQQVEEVLVTVKAGSAEAKRLVEMFAENLDNLEAHASDIPRLRYYVAEGKALLRMQGIARR